MTPKELRKIADWFDQPPPPVGIPSEKPLSTVLRDAADEIERLRNILRAPLSSGELKLVDNNCDWVAFKHAWNSIVKTRLQIIG